MEGKTFKSHEGEAGLRVGCIFQCPFGWLPPAPSSHGVQGGTQNSEECREGELDKGSLAEGSHPKGGEKKGWIFLKRFYGTKVRKRDNSLCGKQFGNFFLFNLFFFIEG